VFATVRQDSRPCWYLANDRDPVMGWAEIFP
jgi:hypothetical protein